MSDLTPKRIAEIASRNHIAGHTSRNAEVAKLDKRIAELEADLQAMQSLKIDNEYALKNVKILEAALKTIAEHHNSRLSIPTPTLSDPVLMHVAVGITNVMRELHTERRDFALKALGEKT